MEETKRNCELCDGEAAFYCHSDNAFLCYACDAKVHSANFLVARHVRYGICCECGRIRGDRVSGAGVQTVAKRVACRNCTEGEAEGDGGVDGGDDDDDLSSCVSSTGEGVDERETTSLRKRREKGSGGKRRERNKVGTEWKVEGVLVNWWRRMAGGGGGGGGIEEEREMGEVVSMAVGLLTGVWETRTAWPFRVSLAAAFWVAMRVVRRRRNGPRLSSSPSSSTWQDLRSVEQISGVPAKLILAAESKLSRGIKRRQSREDHEEGWAEC